MSSFQSLDNFKKRSVFVLLESLFRYTNETAFVQVYLYYITDNVIKFTACHVKEKLNQ